MNVEIFGLSEKIFKNRINTEINHLNIMFPTYQKVMNEIKNTVEFDGWQSIVLSHRTEIREKEKIMLLYCLRRCPNLISRLSEKMKTNAPDMLKPRDFKYVKKNYRQSLGMKSNFYRNLTQDFFDLIYKKIPIFSEFTTDSLIVLEYLSTRALNKWCEITPIFVAVQTGEPIENVLCVLNFFLKSKMISFAKIKNDRQKGRSKFLMRLSLTEDDYIEASKNLPEDTIQFINFEDALDENFNFFALKHFYSLIGENFEFPNIEDLQQEIPQIETDTIISETEIELPEKNEKIVEPVIKEVPVYIHQNSEETLEIMQQCLKSFTEIAESLNKNEKLRGETYEKILNREEQLQKENDSLRLQNSDLRKIISKKTRDKNQFVKNVQDNLNILMGQIVNETSRFVNTPRHLINEQKMADFVSTVIDSVVNVSKNIQKIASE